MRCRTDDEELENAEEVLDALVITVEVVADIRARAIESYNVLPVGHVVTRRRGRRSVTDADRPSFLVRVIENHVRHNHTNYVELLALMPSETAKVLLRWRVSKAIRAGYPMLAKS